MIGCAKLRPHEDASSPTGLTCRTCRRPVATYDGERQHRRGRSGRAIRGSVQNFRGPRCALSLDEQLEVIRAMSAAANERRHNRVANELAHRYGVSSRTIWRYARKLPVPQGSELLRGQVEDWADERGISLTTDDIVTLLLVLRRRVEVAA